MLAAFNSNYMFNKDFFPTPTNVIQLMLEGFSLEGKTILEPSAGKGDIVDFCSNHGANVIACELNDDLRHIVASKCKLIAHDFLTVTSEQISHVDMIVMNPPFSADEHHILHAYTIAPDGCQIIALCNLNTVKNDRFSRRRELRSIVDTYGSWQDIGAMFSDAERPTDVEIGLIRIQKPGGGYQAEFEGFFMDDDPEEEQGNGIMPYNVVRDLVNRYVEAVKLYDKQMELGVQMNYLLGSFYKTEIGFTCTEEGKPKLRADFKKDLQKSAWKYLFKKLNMEKYATKGLKDDINKFVEQQTQVPFTMRNIYRMLDIIVGTQAERMDRALIEIFDKLTMHYHENRYNVEGWKTNSHYLVNKKFILNWVSSTEWGRAYIRYQGNSELVDDLVKALCYLTGENYNSMNTIYHEFQSKPVGTDENGRTINEYKDWGTWYDWTFFRVKLFKKGTGHFEFKDPDVWALFNQNIARIKGYPLFEHVSKRR
jgi:hypothetical protein